MRISAWIDGFAPAEGPPPRTLWRFLRWALRGAFPAMFLAAAVSALAGAMEVLSALLLGVVIDGALEAGPDFLFRDWPMLLGVALFFVVLRPTVFGASSALQSMTVAPNVYPLVLSRLNRHTMGHSVGFFENDFAGRIAQKQMQTARAITDIAMECVNVVAFALASMVGSALLLTTIDWRVAVALSVWLAGYLALIRWFLPRVRERSGDRAAARAMLSGRIVDTISNVRTVKLFARQQREDTDAREGMEHFRDRTLHFGRLSAAFRYSLMTVAGTLPVFLLGGTLWLWSLGQASAGDIAATGAVAIRIAQMTGWVSFVLMTLYGNVGEAEDGMRTLAPGHGLTDAPDAGELRVTRGEIQFQSVSFAYGRQIGGIGDVSVTVAPGEKLGIVGASGSGKSTLVALLLRLYDTERGRVLIDGQDVSGVTQDSLRSRIGMVTQETAMFNRSARDNIRYGNLDASDTEIIRAAKYAEAHEFIEGLEDFIGRKGYDAHLGERGVRLSGGQRQRIALARAILKDAPILVLDEATSALDSEVEASIQAALDRAMEDKTVLAIAHRLSTIARMDRIIVLNEGRIVEEGAHRELLLKGGLYSGFWSRQFGGFIGVDTAAE